MTDAARPAQARLSPTAADLAPGALAEALPAREVRGYPALLSTEATAMAWAREGAPSGSVVVADYQASPRGRAGLPWQTRPGVGLGATVLLRPALPPEREGWPYVAALLALYDVVSIGLVGDDHAVLEWPDSVREPDGRELAALGTYAELGPGQMRWVAVTVLLPAAEPPRVPLLAALVQALEHRMGQPAEQVLEQYRGQCTTIGRQVRARLIPMGDGGPEIIGEAVDVLADGALVIRTPRGVRVAVLPQNLGLLEPPAEPARPPDRLFGAR